MRIALVSALLLGLAACTTPPDLGPPEGWVADGDRWFQADADTALAFRDLSTISAMGVAREDDSEFVRWTQEELTQLYRTNPEVVDSVFGAEFLDDIQAGAPAGDDYETAARSLVNDISRDFYQRYNPAIKNQTQFAVPDTLTDVQGAVVLQVYVEDNRAVALEMLEGTGTALDALIMRDAATATYTDAWVRETAGRSAGVTVPTWVRIRQPFNQQ